MDLYFIVKKGEQPGNEGAANIGGICAAWFQSENKDETEVIGKNLATGAIVRLSAAESEKIARDFLSPKFQR